jgi:hypothetical protein
MVSVIMQQHEGYIYIGNGELNGLKIDICLPEQASTSALKNSAAYGENATVHAAEL